MEPRESVFSIKWWINEKELKVEPLFTGLNSLFIKWAKLFNAILTKQGRNFKNIWNLVKTTKKDLYWESNQYEIIKHLELYCNSSLPNEDTILNMTDKKWLESWKLYQLLLYKNTKLHNKLLIFYKKLLNRGSPRMTVQTIFQMMKSPDNIVWHKTIATGSFFTPVKSNILCRVLNFHRILL